jgi:hypothetical protein
MRKGPYIAWFPGDIKGDTALQMVSLGAFGLWHKMLYIMHDSDPYGHLSVKGRVIPQVNLARMCGCTVDELDVLIRELEEHDIFSRTEAGVIYSRRMVRDAKVSERARNNGRKGGNPRLVTDPPSSPSSVNLQDNLDNNPPLNLSLGIGNGIGNGNGSGEEKGCGEKPPSLPHSDQEFAKAWDRWRQYADRGGQQPSDDTLQEDLSLLGEYHPEFATSLLDTARRGKWSHFHFPNTKGQYAAWQKARTQPASRGKPSPTERAQATIQERGAQHVSLKEHLTKNSTPPHTEHHDRKPAST